MTETPGEYGVEDSSMELQAHLEFPELWDKLKRLDESPNWKKSRAVASRYYQEIAEFSRAIIMSGATNDPEEIVDTAIQIPELIIEKTKDAE